MNTAHITEVKLWADILSETSQKYQKSEGITRYSNICEGSLNVAHEAGAQQGKRDIERARTQTPSTFSFFVRLIFGSSLSLDAYPSSSPFLSPKVSLNFEEANVIIILLFVF